MNQGKIGKFIQELRIEAGYTQKELGDMIGVTDNSVSKWERGINLPDISCIRTLAEIFGITEQELLNGERIKYVNDIKADLIQKYRYKLIKSYIISMIIFLLLGTFTLLPPDPITLEEFILAMLFFAIVNYIIIKLYYVIKRKREYKKILKGNFKIKEKRKTNNINVHKEKVVSDESNINIISIKKSTRIILLIVFILSIASIFLALLFPILVVRTKIPANDLSFLPNMTIAIFKFFKISYGTVFAAPYAIYSIFTIFIPIVSVVLGIIYKHKGYKCTKNIVGGIITGFIVFCISIGPSINNIDALNDYGTIKNFKEIVNLELPSTGNAYSSTSDLKIEYNYFLFKNDEEIDKLEDSIKGNKNWDTFNNLYNSFYDILINSCQEDNCSYSIYNIDTKEYNTVPRESGVYNIYTMMYDPSTKSLKIIKLMAKK